MRYVASCLVLGSLLALAGCSGTFWSVIKKKDDNPIVPAQTPSVAKLVEYLDLNAQRVQGIRCTDVALNVHQGWKPIPELSCNLACQRPRNFRMQAQLSIASSQEVDVGSNNQEFWFWIKRSPQPYQYFCSYQDLTEGRVRALPFPFQPDWVMETLGLGTYGPPENYKLTVEPQKLILTRYVKGPQGNTLRKIIVFNRWEAKGSSPQVTDYLLIDDATNKEVCAAHVLEVQGNLQTGIVPKRIKLRCTMEEKTEMTLKLSHVQFNPQMPQELFVRRPLASGPSIDLATMRPEGQLNGFQRTGLR